MKKLNIIYILLLLLGTACTDNNEHYDRSGSLSDKNLYELIKADGELSNFAELLAIAGYDSLLVSSQTFTVWAPTNAAFSGQDISAMDKTQARTLAANYIARFNNSTTMSENTSIRMWNDKVYYFSEGGSSFGGSLIDKCDLMAKNGLLHTLETLIPYKYNIYEYIMSNSNTTKLAAFIRSFEEERILNAADEIILDTIKASYNALFDFKRYGTNIGLGTIYNEDSVYTMIIPTDRAWDEVYSRIEPYFVTYSTNQAYADSLKNQQISLAIVQDLVYRGRISNPAAQPVLMSTNPIYPYTIINNPASLFSGSVATEASNGMYYVADRLNYVNAETWNKPIVVEAESMNGRVTGPNTSVYTKLDETGIYGGHYVTVQPETPTAQPTITFAIPQVLSGKYDIYVEFIPFEGFENDSTKLLFELAYMRANGTQTTRLVNTADLVTSGTKKVSMLVLPAFEFPVSNYYDWLWDNQYYEGKYTADDRVVNTSLMVRTNVTNAERNNGVFSRRFNIDRIILEPATN